MQVDKITMFVRNLNLISRRLYSKMVIKEGDKLPSVKLHENTPKEFVDISSLFSGKRGIIFGVPGAFTPGCSKTHLPGYVTDFDKFKSKGIDLIVCVSVNDAFVMSAWGEANKASGKVKMLADTKAEFTRALGLEVDLTEALGTVRSKRYSMLINDGKVEKLFVEPDGTGLTCSLANNILNSL